MKVLGSLFGETIYSWQDSEDWSEQEKFYMEQELLGVGVSKHPLQAIASKAIYPITPISNLSENSYAIILVEVQKIKVIRTKKGENMAFLQVDDSKKKIGCYPLFRFISTGWTGSKRRSLLLYKRKNPVT